MASGFPGSIDNFTDPTSTSALNSPSHSGQHADLNDAVEKIETYMGLVFIKSATVTNAADSGNSFQSIFDGRFNSYRIVCHTLTAVTNGSLPRMTFFYSTTTEQTSTYYSAVTNAGLAGTTSVTAVNNGAYIGLGAACDTIGSSGFSLDIHRVGSSGRGTVNIQFIDAYTASFAAGGGLVATTRTYDGVKFFMSAGNISMTASVYGYRN